MGLKAQEDKIEDPQAQKEEVSQYMMLLIVNLKIVSCQPNMRSIFQRLKLFSRENIPGKIVQYHSHYPISEKPLFSILLNHKFHSQQSPNPNSVQSQIHSKQTFEGAELVGSAANFDELAELTNNSDAPDDKSAVLVQNLLKDRRDCSIEEVDRALDRCQLSLTEGLVLNVLRRHRSDWKPAYTFFNWVARGGGGSGYSPGTGSYNEILDILGRMKRFDELNQVLDEMSKRKGLVNERTYGIVVHRYAAAHKLEEATNVFYKRKEFGLELDLIAFQTLLMALCRYKHVEAAEFLFHSKRNEFRIMDIKTRNIILNGWCVLGSLREAKRFWNDIVTSKCKPDKYTYGIFINLLTKAGKLNTAVTLFKTMWQKGCTPDVAICNCIIDALCFKKRIPEALEIFREMNEKNCLPDVATYNSLIKHLCKISRMEKVIELLNEMEKKKGSCLPNARTYGYLLKSMKKPEEVPMLMERMERIGCTMTDDTYNLILKLYMDWDDQEKVRSTWVEMEKHGLGPDQRSYTIMIHGLYDNGRIDDALRYFNEMKSKGMVAEPRTNFLVNAMNIKLEEREGKPKESGAAMNDDDSLRRLSRRGMKKRAR